MGCDVLMSLLKTGILGDIVQVIPTNNNRPLHFGRDDHSTENATTDGNVPCEGALFIDIMSINSFFCRFKTKSNRSEVTSSLCSFLLAHSNTAFAHKYRGLFLEGMFRLIKNDLVIYHKIF